MAQISFHGHLACTMPKKKKKGENKGGKKGKQKGEKGSEELNNKEKEPFGPPPPTDREVALKTE